MDILDEWADLLAALNQLRLAIDTAAEARAEYLRKTATSNVNATESETTKAIQRFRRREGLMTKEESEEYDRKNGPTKPT